MTGSWDGKERWGLEKKPRVRKWEVGLSKAHYTTTKIVNTKTELSKKLHPDKGQSGSQTLI